MEIAQAGQRVMTGKRAIKDILYGEVEQLVKGMASAKRLELIELLCQAPKPVEILAAQAQISEKLASAHLRALRQANLVETEKQGRHVIYRIASPEVAGLLVAVRQLAEDRSFALQRSLAAVAASTEPWAETDPKTLLRRARKGEVTVIDVRPVAEYEAGHFPHALSVPIEELRRRLKQLPKDKPVVAYCRGPFCLMSVDAVKLLHDAGFEAYQWREGAADWLAAAQKKERAS